MSCIELPTQTAFRHDFVRTYVISVRSSISFEVYWGLYFESIKRPTRNNHKTSKRVTYCTGRFVNLKTNSRCLCAHTNSIIVQTLVSIYNETPPVCVSESCALARAEAFYSTMTSEVSAPPPTSIFNQLCFESHGEKCQKRALSNNKFPTG